MLAQVVERFQIGVEPLFLRIRDEDDAIGALQNQAATRFVKYLAGNRIEMEARLESAHGAEIERKKIEEKGAIGLGRERDHFPLLARARMLVNPLQIGGLPAQAGTVVHELAVNFASGKIYKWHNFLKLRQPLTYSTGSGPRQRDGRRVLRN